MHRCSEVYRGAIINCAKGMKFSFLQSTYKTMQRFSLFTALMICLAMTGCNRDGLPGLVPAAGIVTLNGVPVERAIISFAPTSTSSGVRSASAMTDQNGRFVVTTLNYGDGIHPGEYQIIVTKTTGTGGDLSPEESGRGGSGDDRQMVNHLPSKYGNKDTSGLTVSISSKGDRNIELKLEGEIDTIPQRPAGPRR